MTTKSASYKLATQAILMAYELLAPDPRSADDLKQHLTTVKRLTDLHEPECSDREIFFESMTIFNKGIKHDRWFYRD